MTLTPKKTPRRFVLLPLAGVCAAALAAGCTSGSDDNNGTAGSAGSGMPAAGGAGGSTGGSGASGGSGGSTGGSSAAAGAGGSTGGSGGTTGGSGAMSGAGGSTGGSGGSTGGSGSGAAAGMSGSDAGGSAGSGTAGSGMGGQVATGGSAGSGTVVVDRPGLVTSGPNAYWKPGTLTAGSGNATVKVDATKTYQDWIGFGGTFNEQGWDALSVLGEADRAKAITLLFSPADGANFKWGRLPIGASDYAMDRYTLNENAGDYEMTKFSIDRDKMRLIPYIKAALAVKPDVRLWASPWTPPSWMKDPPQIDGTDAGPNGQAATYEAFMKDDDKTLAALALYFARFVEDYAKEGVTIDAVFPQNEPGYSTRYPSCRWASGLLGKFVGNYLGPKFKERNLSTQIWFGTLSNNDSAIYSGNIGGLMGAAEDYVVGVGFQWNTIGHTGELAQRGYLVMQTEHRCGNYPFSVAGTPAFNPNKPANDHAYAVESWGYIRDWLKAGVNSYSAWNMVLDVEGKNLDVQRPWPQNALLVVDRNAKTLITTPVYYVFRHFSYFVDPGAKRIDAAGGDAIAFKNPDGSLVAVVFNSGNAAASTTVSMGGSTYQVDIPGQGWATLYTKGA